MLKGSPVNINKPLRNNSPEENKVSWSQGCILNASIKNRNAESKSSPPKILTSTIKKSEWLIKI
jgi:hypothetical protein